MQTQQAIPMAIWPRGILEYIQMEEPAEIDLIPKVKRVGCLSGQPPAEPLVLPASPDRISWAKAMNALRTIVMKLWPPRILRYSQMKESDKNDWLARVLGEWHLYYRYEDDGIVKSHIARNFRKWMQVMRDKAKTAVEKNPGTRLHDHGPPYLKPDTWNILCDWWHSDAFKRRSTAAKVNRCKGTVQHTPGATTKERKRPRTSTELSDTTHPKESNEFVSKSAAGMQIVETSRHDLMAANPSQERVFLTEIQASSTEIGKLHDGNEVRCDDDKEFDKFLDEFIKNNPLERYEVRRHCDVGFWHLWDLHDRFEDGRHCDDEFWDLSGLSENVRP